MICLLPYIGLALTVVQVVTFDAYMKSIARAYETDFAQRYAMLFNVTYYIVSEMLEVLFRFSFMRFICFEEK